jgi:cell division protein FtsN
MKPDSITSETAPNPGVKNDSPAPVEVQPEVAKPLVGKFSVIAGCFKNRGNAERLHKQLIEKGYPATVTTSKNGQLYKVHVQTFSTRSEAITGLARIKSAEPGMQLWAAL